MMHLKMEDQRRDWTLQTLNEGHAGSPGLQNHLGWPAGAESSDGV